MPLRAECVLAQLAKAVAHRLDGLDDILICDMLTLLELGNIILARNRGHVARQSMIVRRGRGPAAPRSASVRRESPLPERVLPLSEKVLPLTEKVLRLTEGFLCLSEGVLRLSEKGFASH